MNGDKKTIDINEIEKLLQNGKKIILTGGMGKGKTNLLNSLSSTNPKATLLDYPNILGAETEEKLIDMGFIKNTNGLIITIQGNANDAVQLLSKSYSIPTKDLLNTFDYILVANLKKYYLYKI